MKERIARHVVELPKSGIRKFFDIVAQSKGIVSLGVGEPDFDTPWHISRAAVTCLENGGTHYTSNLGTPELRQAIVRYLGRRFGAAFDWQKEVLVTVGVSEAIDLAVRALCSPGDEILYHEPCFVSYAPTVRLAHAVPVCVETHVADEFRLTVEALEAKVTPKTKALLLNFPCNPTGATLSRDDMLAILKFAEKHDLIILADEVYSELNYEVQSNNPTIPHPLLSFSSFPEYRDRVVLLNGFSKSWAMTGYRLGYACGPADIIDAMMKIHQYGIMSAPTLAQAAGVEAMDHGDKDVARMRREYMRRRDYLVPALNEMGLKTVMPRGAFYIFSSVASTGLDDEAFALKLLKEYGVACVPGSAFGKSGAGFVRMSYATSYEKIQLAVKRIGRMLTGGCFLLFTFFLGCANPGREEREQYSNDFRTNLVAETVSIVKEAGGSLTLSNAVALAHERTLKLARQDLEAALARVNSATVFSAFLPTLAFTGGGTLISGGIYDAPLLGDIKGEGVRLNGGSMIVAQPVFTPVAWVMFAESLYGIRIKDIVRERAEQLLDVQVAALFCQAAVAERMVKTYELQLESGWALTNRLTRLAAEGYALASDRARAEARCAVDAAALMRAQNARAKAHGDLAEILRLWPLADFNVDGDTILALKPLEEKSVEEWVWEGLVTRKDLYAGDQTLELRKARVIEALAGFLPNVVLGGGGANCSLESVVAKGWAGSLMGTWAAFEGFRTVQQYRAARAEREAEYKLQEDRMLAVVVAVADCWRNLNEARQQAMAARVYAEAARLDCAATERRYEDGQETLSAVLDKIAVRDDAEGKATRAGYGEALAAIMLRQAAGRGLF